MATYTENYNLLVTETEDGFDILDYNDNFEAIDTVLAEHETQMNEVNAKLGTPDEGETVFSLLKNNGGSLIKSVQRVTYQIIKDTESGSVSISPVDSSKSFVLFERLQDNSSYPTKVDYTLTDTSIEVTHSDESTSSRLIGFWIIEFN